MKREVNLNIHYITRRALSVMLELNVNESDVTGFELIKFASLISFFFFFFFFNLISFGGMTILHRNPAAYRSVYQIIFFPLLLFSVPSK